VEDYTWRITTFFEFVRLQGSRVDRLDSLVLQKHDGQKLKAAVLHFYPALKRPNIKPLARFERSLKAWGRRRPALGRLPPPYPAVCGVAVALHLLGRADTAVAALVGLSAYLRPGELRELRARDVTPPGAGFGPECQRWSLILGPSDEGGDPTNTSVCDDNVTPGRDSLKFPGHFLDLFRTRKQPKDQL
ncbi:unnamed protein product, partial [Prorocentrum cordatum]